MKNAPAHRSGTTADVPEVRVAYAARDPTSAAMEVEPEMVSRFQMGELVRKCVSSRLLALSAEETASLMTAMRQIGVGAQGGAEALATFHQLVFDE